MHSIYSMTSKDKQINYTEAEPSEYFVEKYFFSMQSIGELNPFGYRPAIK